jgi:hypothetical protein
MQTVIGADTIIVFIDYANAIITIPLSEVELLGESSVSIQYQYNPTILVNTSDNEETGQLKPGVIYSVSTIRWQRMGLWMHQTMGLFFELQIPQWQLILYSGVLQRTERVFFELMFRQGKLTLTIII